MTYRKNVCFINKYSLVIPGSSETYAVGGIKTNSQFFFGESIDY